MRGKSTIQVSGWVSGGTQDKAILLIGSVCGLKPFIHILKEESVMEGKSYEFENRRQSDCAASHREHSAGETKQVPAPK